jgi:hypothetical protein
MHYYCLHFLRYFSLVVSMLVRFLIVVKHKLHMNVPLEIKNKLILQ